MHTYKLGLLLLRPHGWPIKEQTYNGSSQGQPSNREKTPLLSLPVLLFISFRFFSLLGRERRIRQRIPRQYLKRTDGLSPTAAERIYHVRESERAKQQGCAVAHWRLYEITRVLASS